MTERQRKAIEELLAVCMSHADKLEEDEATYKQRKMKLLARGCERQWKRLMAEMGIVRNYLREIDQESGS